MSENVITKDYWTIILLTSSGFGPTEIESAKRESGNVEKIYTFGSEACTVYNDYIAGKEILLNFHDVERAASLFKKNLHSRN
jgi:hypothetical protein